MQKCMNFTFPGTWEYRECITTFPQSLTFYTEAMQCQQDFRRKSLPSCCRPTLFKKLTSDYIAYNFGIPLCRNQIKSREYNSCY